MQEINQFLKRETKEFRRKTIREDTEMKDKKAKAAKKKLQEKYDQWLINLKELFSNKLYRQVIREIEEKKYHYKLLKTEFWKIKLLRAKAILKIIRRKMTKHNKEVFLENSTQNFSLKFWFNQIFVSLEELCLEIRFDINPHMDPNSKEIFIIVQSLAEAHLEFLYYLCIFAINTGDVMALLTYISNTDKLKQYLNLLLNNNIYDLFLDIQLIKIKLLIQNCNYIPALDSILVFFKIFFKDVVFYLDLESPITSEILSSSKKKDKKRNFGLCTIILKMIMVYYLRGVISEHLGFYKNSIKAYQQCRWFSNVFMPNFNKPVFKYFRNMEKKYIVYNEVFKDIQEQFEERENKTKQKKKNKSQRILFLKKKNFNNSMENIKYKNIQTMKNKNYRRLRSSSVGPGMNKKQLVKVLNSIGKRLYKEEANRTNNVFNKFGPNNFVLSTVNMVNNLLSKPFRDVLKKMDKVEVTKPKEEIKYLINKTLTIKRRKEFKEEMDKRAKIRHKKNHHSLHRNKSTSTDLNSTINQNKRAFNTSIKQKFKLIQRNNENKTEKGKENNRYEASTSNVMRSKFFLTSMKDSKYKYTNKSTISNYNKINKYSPDKDVFSNSLQKKKKFLDKFFEKELVFQKKLLKLKSYDMEKITTDDYNPQQVIKSAEQDFKIIKCFAESKNAKKNLINLVGENELKNWEFDLKNKTRMRTNRKMNLLNINSLNNFMRLHHISQTRAKYDPNNYEKNNDEKTKILTMECAKLEEMQNKCQIQKDILRNQILGYKSKKVDIYKIN